MSVRLSKSLVIIGVLLAIATALFNLRPMRHSLAQGSTLQTVESDHPRVVQGGTWSSQTANAASNGTYLYSSGAEADVLSLAFIGQAIEILYSAGPSLGTLAIEVDGTVLRTVITTDTKTRYGQSAKISYLTDEPHTLKVYAQAGGVIAIDAFVITPFEPSSETAATSAEQPTELRNCPFVDTETQRLSVGPGNVQANSLSELVDISADGRYVAFTSFASNLTPEDPSDRADVFVLDRQTCNLRRFPFPPDVLLAPIIQPLVLMISPDGNYLYYAVSSSQSGWPPFFIGARGVFHIPTGTFRRLPNDLAWRSITNRYLIARECCDLQANFVLYDFIADTYPPVNVGVGGMYFQMDDTSVLQAISGDGRYIAFSYASANNPFANCTSPPASTRQLYLHDRQTATTNCISRAADGTLANRGTFSQLEFSADGRYLAFRSDASNLTPGQLDDGLFRIYVHDLQTGQNELVSLVDNTPALQPIMLDFPGNGRYVLFVHGPSNDNNEIIVFDRELDISLGLETGMYFANHQYGALTADGRLAVFNTGDALLEEDTNGFADIYAVPVASRIIAPRLGDTLALFRPDLGAMSLISNIQDVPPPSVQNTYTTNAPAAAMNGSWVMGDWDGDGEDTPGVYATNGVFYYTNEIGASTTWAAVWVGLVNTPVVAGRFDAGVNHDCIGAVDSANFPPHGTAFALYFTCDLTDGTPPALSFQWLSVLLPDAAGFSGTHQFAAGDFDNNGVDSIAVRRGEFISFGNVPPTTLLSEFSLAQYWGVPLVTGGEAGIFLMGDFDNTAGDSFGVFYQNGHFYYRNAIEWNPAGHLLQRVGQPIGTPVQATSWR